VLATGAAPSGAALGFVVAVANTGARAGDEVVQAYFAPRATPAQPASRLRRQLFGYARVHLAPGGVANVSFAVDSATLRMVDRRSGDTVSTPGAFDIVLTNGAGQDLTTRVEVQGQEVVVARFPSA
jgi:beta-glucosidase